MYFIWQTQHDWSGSPRGGAAATLGFTREVEAAGFRLIAEGDFWHLPEDMRDFSALWPTGSVDEFVLKFQKPDVITGRRAKPSSTISTISATAGSVAPHGVELTASRTRAIS